MQLSEARIESNRRDAILAKAQEIASQPSGAKGLDGWLAGQIVVISERIGQCQATEQALRVRIVARAQVTWAEDRKCEATLLASTISKRPEQVSARLRETLQGCEWLLNRWAWLARAADVQGGWTLEQTGLAFDLLGTPIEFREGQSPGALIDERGKPIASPGDPAALARRQIDVLIERRELLRPIDQAERERAEADLAGNIDPEMRQLRRYEAELLRRLQWTLNLLEELSEPEPSAPEPEPSAESTLPAAQGRATSVKPQVAPPLPSDLSRLDRRLLRAESRRESHRRKLEKLRS